jgi:uncharacterized membrane protein
MPEVYPLHEVPLFRNLPDLHLSALHGAAVRRLYPAGETIFEIGDTTEMLYIVESGGVDIVLPSAGEEIILASFETGSFFGELSIFDRQPRTATARANQETSLITIPANAVIALIDSHPPAARQFITVVAQRLRGANELLARLQIKNVNAVLDERMTFGDRIADAVARFGGSWTFIILFSLFLLAWMGLNTYWVLAKPPDPFPYIFLNLMLSTVAALQAPVIMMSQNRQSLKDRFTADQDFQVNVKAEHAIQQLHRKIDELRALLLQHRQAEEREKQKTQKTG